MAGEEFRIGLGVELSQASLETIRTQLNNLNNNRYRVRLDIDTTRVQSQLNNIRNQIQNLSRIRINLSGNVSGGGGTGGIQRTVVETTQAYNDLMRLAQRINSIRVQIAPLDASKNASQITNLSRQLNRLMADYNNLYETFHRGFDTNQIDNLNLAFETTSNKISVVNSKIADARTQLLNSINVGFDNGTFANQYSQIETNLSRIKVVSIDVASSLRELNTAYMAMETARANGDNEALINSYNRYNDILKQVNNQIQINLRTEQQLAAAERSAATLEANKQALSAKMDLWLQRNSAAAKQFGGQIQNLKTQLNSVNDVSGLKRVEAEFSKINSQAILAGKNVKTFGDRLKAQFGNIASYFSAYYMVFQAIRILKDVFDIVVKIDTEMTELKKVTDETASSYNAFLTNASKKAKELGTTIDGLVSSTADFARLGYSFKESQELAEVANIYAVVGDEVESVEDATKSLISTMAAFGDEVTAMQVIDKFNEVGNNFAISSGGIGEALQRSVSSLAAANNTLDQSIALITAANTVVQNPENVGTAFKTISMRIRGAKTELEEAGLETEGMVESTAKLRKEIKAISGVDIMLDENTFKSTYDIMDELAEKWQDLTDIERATITEMIAGKRQGNVVSALMTNFDIARDALKTSSDSEGSASEEHEKWMESLEAKINQLKATWQDLSRAFLETDFLKDLLDTFKELVEVLNIYVKTLGTFGSIGAGIVIFRIFKSVIPYLNIMIPLLNESGWSFKNLGTAASMAGADLKNFAKTPAGVATSIGLIVAAIGLAVQAYKNWEAEQARLREETLNTNNEILDSVDAFEQAYVKYSGKTRLTSEEENELKTAIDGTVSALGDKASAIQSVIDKNIDYIDSIESVSEAELKEAQRIAKENLKVANDALSAEAWDELLGDKTTVSLGTNKSDDAVKKAKDIAESIMEDYIVSDSKGKRGAKVIEYEIKPINWDKDHSDMDVVVDYYYKLIELKETLSQKSIDEKDDSYINNSVYEGAVKKINLLSNSVEEYLTQQYNLAKYEYELQHGIPKTVEEYIAMKNAILDNIDASQDYKDAISDIADTDLGANFDLDSYYKKANQIKAILENFNVVKWFGESAEKEKAIDDFNNWLNSLSDKEIGIVYKIALSNSDEARNEMLSQLESLGKGGNVDLTVRPIVDAQELIDADWENVGEGAATVFTSTFANEAAELGEDGGIAMNFTPIMVDEVGNHIGTLTPDELEKYAMDVISGVREDDLGLKIGATYNGADAIAQAEADAIKIHELHEQYLLTPSFDWWTLQDWQDALDNYQIPESEKFSFSELMSDEGFTDKIDKHTEKIKTLKDALDKVKDGSFDNSDFIELTKVFPELADDADNLEEAIQEVIDSSNFGTFEDLISYLDYMQSDADYTALQNLINALTDAEVAMTNVLDFTDFLDNLNNVVDSFDSLVDAMSKLREGTALTKGEIVDLISEYPDLLTVSNLFTDGSIAGQQAMLDNLLKVYEAEYNATIDTKIAELKAANEILNVAIDNEKAKAQVVLEISALEVNGKVENQAALLEKLKEFNDLDGKNYVEYANGVLSVNQEMLDNQLAQETQKGELSTENVWKPQAVAIAESYAQGGSAGLSALNTVGNRLATWINGLKEKFKSLAKTIKAALTGESYDDGAGSTTIDTEVEVDVSGITFNGDEVKIDEKSVSDWASNQQEIIQERINQILGQIDTNNIAIENLEALKGLDLVGTYGGSGSSGSSGSNSKSKSSETFDWIEVAIERVQNALSKLDRTANNTYESWDTRNTALKDQIIETGKEIELQNKAYKKYMTQANSVGLSESWKKKVQDGSIDISTIDTTEDSGKALVEKIKSYQEWYNKALKCKDAVEELQVSESELYKQAFDNVITEYEGYLSVIEHEKSMLDEYIAQSEAKGHIVSTKYYEALISNEEANIAKLKDEKNALLSSLEKGIKNGAIKKYSEEWYGMCQQIDEVTLSIEEANTSVIEFGNSIREIEWSVFDLIQEQISQITKESDFLIELMSNDKLYDDRGQLTDIGMSTMGLHGVNYNVYMAQAEKYAQEILDIDKELANDPYNQDLITRRQELLDLQQQSILSAEDEKQAIVDMVREGIELELDALQELITAYTDALDAQKDLYDYQKKIAEQTKEIASLEKQMSAYAGDTSEEAKAKIQQIKVSLEEAKTNLEETQYDRYISDTKQLLDDLYLEYETILNQRLDNVDALLADMIQAINNNAITINSTLSTEAGNVGYTISESMQSIWNTGSDNLKTVLVTYGSGIQNSILSVGTTVSGAIGAIGASYQQMLNKLNEQGENKAQTASNSSATDSKQANTTSKTSNSNSSSSTTNTTKSNNTSSTSNKQSTPTTNSSTSNKTSDTKITVGSTVNAKGAKIYDYAGDKSGENQYFKSDPVYVVLGEKDGYVKVRWHDLDSGVTGWFKKSDVKAYKTGKQNFLTDEVAWTQDGGREFIVRPSDGAILTPIAQGDSVLNASASNNIWDMANSPSEFIRDNLKLDKVNTPIGQGGQTNYTQHLDKVVFNLPNVKNYDELLSAMQHDKNFERLILAMTIDRVVGGSSLAKGKAIRR